MSASRIAAEISARNARATDVVEEYLDRIDRLDPVLGAFTVVDRRGARLAAIASDRYMAAGGEPRLLEGVPISVKDSFDVAGLRTSVGRLSDSYVPTEDGPLVSRLRAAGAVILGKTNVPVMLDDWQTANRDFGRTMNPWDEDSSPGGSSGGAAAAIAAGLSAGDLGSDLYGSIRLPAAWCGIVGLRPSLGELSKLGHAPWPRNSLLEPSFSTAGPLTRSVRDVVLFWTALGGDPISTLANTGIRVGLWLDDSSAPITESSRATLMAFADQLQHAGAEIVDFVPPFSGKEGVELANLLIGVELAHNYDDESSKRLSALSRNNPEMAWARNLDQTISSVWTLWERQARLRNAWDAGFESVDVVLAPATYGSAPLMDEAIPAERRLVVDGVDLVALDVVSAWSKMTNVISGPALTVPAGLDAVTGLPVGIQLLGPHGSDSRIVSIAAEWERTGLIESLTHPA
ncbi:amidase [soil metagenome]